MIAYAVTAHSFSHVLLYKYRASITRRHLSHSQFRAIGMRASGGSLGRIFEALVRTPVLGVYQERTRKLVDVPMCGLCRRGQPALGAWRVGFREISWGPGFKRQLSID